MSDENEAIKRLADLFKDIEVIELDPGDHVYCDSCNEDYMNSEEKGGILFESKAICPKCQDEWIEGARKYHELLYIRAYAKDDESFRDFVYRIRKDKW